MAAGLAVGLFVVVAVCAEAEEKESASPKQASARLKIRLFMVQLASDDGTARHDSAAGAVT